MVKSAALPWKPRSQQANDLSVIKDALAFKLHIFQNKQGPKQGCRIKNFHLILFSVNMINLLWNFEHSCLNKLAILEIAQDTAYPWGAEMGA